MPLAARTSAPFGRSRPRASQRISTSTSRRMHMAARASSVTQQCALSAAIAAGSLLLSAGTNPAWAVGIESIDMPTFQPAEAVAKMQEGARQKAAEADEKFRNSDTLKELLARSEANKAKNKRDLQNKYCYRQAEWGVGDCGGLNDIPGMTQNGKQETPDWLAKMLGVEDKVKEMKQQTPSVNLEKLLGPKPAF